MPSKIPRTVMPFRVLRVVAFYLALLGLWQLMAMLHVWPKYVVPPPADVWHAFWTKLHRRFDRIASNRQRMW